MRLWAFVARLGAVVVLCAAIVLGFASPSDASGGPSCTVTGSASPFHLVCTGLGVGPVSEVDAFFVGPDGTGHDVYVYDNTPESTAPLTSGSVDSGSLPTDWVYGDGSRPGPNPDLYVGCDSHRPIAYGASTTFFFGSAPDYGSTCATPNGTASYSADGGVTTTTVFHGASGPQAAGFSAASSGFGEQIGSHTSLIEQIMAGPLFLLAGLALAVVVGLHWLKNKGGNAAAPGRVRPKAAAK